MGLITYIQGYSAIIAVVLMPFQVKDSRLLGTLPSLLHYSYTLDRVSSISDLYPQEIGCSPLPFVCLLLYLHC